MGFLLGALSLLVLADSSGPVFEIGKVFEEKWRNLKALTID